MAEEPKEVLPEIGTTTMLGDVKGRLRGPVEHSEGPGRKKYGSRQGQQCRGRQNRPDEDRYSTPGHARRSIMNDRDQDIEPGGHHSDTDDGESEQIGNHAYARLGL